MRVHMGVRRAPSNHARPAEPVGSIPTHQPVQTRLCTHGNPYPSVRVGLLAGTGTGRRQRTRG